MPIFVDAYFYCRFNLIISVICGLICVISMATLIVDIVTLNPYFFDLGMVAIFKWINTVL